MASYKAVMRPALEYASSIWSPLASSTSINKLQVMQNAALRMLVLMLVWILVWMLVWMWVWLLVSLQAVELSQWSQAAVQIVSNPPAPSNGGPIYRFLGMPAMRTRWMAGAAAHKSG